MRILIAKIWRVLFKRTYFKNMYFGLYQRIFKPFNLFKGVRKTVAFKGFVLSLRLDDWIQQNIYFLGEYEEAELSTLEIFLTKESTFVDIGANLGLFTLCASKIIGEGGSIFSFEPSEENYTALQNNLKINNITNIVAENIAVGERNGNISLFYNGQEKNLGMVTTVPTGNSFLQEAKITTLDAYFNKSRIDRIDFIKIDIEGAEFAALKGMESILKKFQPILLIEILDINDNKDITDYLASFGYVKYFIDNEGGITSTEMNSERLNYIFSVKIM